MRQLLLISLFFSKVSFSQLTNITFSSPADKIGENKSIKTINDSIFVVQHYFNHNLQYWSIYKNNEFIRRKRIPTIFASESKTTTFIDLIVTKNKIIGFWKCENDQATDLYIAYFDSNLELISDPKKYEHYDKEGIHYSYYKKIGFTYFVINYYEENNFISTNFHVVFFHSIPGINNTSTISSYDHVYSTLMYNENIEPFTEIEYYASNKDYSPILLTIIKNIAFKDKKITFQKPKLLIDSTFFFSGTYTTINDLFSLGTFWVKYDLKQDKIIGLELQKIDLKKIAGRGVIKYIGKDSSNVNFDYMNNLYHIDNIIQSSDKGFYLILKSYTYQPTSIPNYYVPDFIIQKLDFAGKLIWSNVIYDIATIYNAIETSYVSPENIDRKYSSVFFIESQNNLNVIFNDNKKNYDNNGMYTITQNHYKNDNKLKHTCIAMISFDILSGTKIRKSISEPNKWKLDYMNDMFISKKNKSYSLIVENDSKQYTFLTIGFE